jgi:hypothetical protein
VGVVGQAERHGRELLDQQHPGAGLGDRGDHRDQAADHDGRQAQRELVDQQVARLRDQRLGQHDHLLLAAGQRPGQRGQPLGELGEQLEDPGPAGLRLLAREGIAGHPQVVLDGQVREQPAAFGDDRDARLPDPLGAPAGEVDSRRVRSVHEHGPGAGTQDAADREDQGGLARAVRPEQRGHLPGGYLDRDLPDHGAPAALDGEVAQEQRAHATPR